MPLARLAAASLLGLALATVGCGDDLVPGQTSVRFTVGGAPEVGRAVVWLDADHRVVGRGETDAGGVARQPLDAPAYATIAYRAALYSVEVAPGDALTAELDAPPPFTASDATLRVALPAAPDGAMLAIASGDEVRRTRASDAVSVRVRAADQPVLIAFGLLAARDDGGLELVAQGTIRDAIVSPGAVDGIDATLPAWDDEVGRVAVTAPAGRLLLHAFAGGVAHRVEDPLEVTGAPATAELRYLSGWTDAATIEASDAQRLVRRPVELDAGAHVELTAADHLAPPVAELDEAAGGADLAVRWSIAAPASIDRVRVTLGCGLRWSFALRPTAEGELRVPPIDAVSGLGSTSPSEAYCVDSVVVEDHGPSDGFEAALAADPLTGALEPDVAYRAAWHTLLPTATPQ